MEITVNGKSEVVAGGETVLGFIRGKRLDPGGIVVRRNGEVLARDRWSDVQLREGDRLDVLKMVGGGSEVSDKLVIGGRELRSRLFIGTGKFPDKGIIPRVIDESGASVVTVALRRVDFDAEDPGDNILNYIPRDCVLMPNTSGARTAREAVEIARIARDSGCGNWVKIEVIPDQVYLMPDNEETIEATRVLAKEGFTVLPYMVPDLSAAKRLRDAGAAAVMPLGAPIGSNRGLKTKELIRILIDQIDLPVIVDAGIGRPSEAAEAMEMGCAAVLVNTALATARDPMGMAGAFSLAVQAGRKAYLSGPGRVLETSEASSPLTGFLFETGEGQS